MLLPILLRLTGPGRAVGCRGGSIGSSRGCASGTDGTPRHGGPYSPSVDAQLVVAVLLAIGFAVTNGLHDASNAIATLVATRAATPLQAILLASVFNLLGPLFLGAAVADTIGGIVTVPPNVTVEVIGAGLAAAVTWNLVTWRLGLPSSSGHALVGGLSAPPSSRAACTRSTGAESRTGGLSACSGS